MSSPKRAAKTPMCEIRGEAASAAAARRGLSEAERRGCGRRLGGGQTPRRYARARHRRRQARHDDRSRRCRS